jgi:pantoate--beta-alanine ligase
MRQLARNSVVEVVQTLESLRRWRATTHRSVGLVPTMGFLHEGHLALVRRARAENDLVAVSIFVNPRQFGPDEDLARYPRNNERDLALLHDESVDLVFVPTVDEMYPSGFSTTVDVGSLGERLEGVSRPGHFKGVATVVARLMNLTRPQRAYFGQKDAQQLIVVRRMVKDLALTVQIEAVPTVREPDGLALSSRNIFLSIEGRQAATALSRALFRAEESFEWGERDANRLRQIVRDLLDLELLVRSDYVSVADASTLDELDLVDRPALLSLAAWVGQTRLIDNLLLEV